MALYTSAYNSQLLIFFLNKAMMTQTEKEHDGNVTNWVQNNNKI